MNETERFHLVGAVLVRIAINFAFPLLLCAGLAIAGRISSRRGSKPQTPNT